MARQEGAVEVAYANIAERPFARALLLLGRMQALQEFMRALERTNPVAAQEMLEWYNSLWAGVSGSTSIRLDLL